MAVQRKYELVNEARLEADRPTSLSVKAFTQKLKISQSFGIQMHLYFLLQKYHSLRCENKLCVQE